MSFVLKWEHPPTEWLDKINPWWREKKAQHVDNGVPDDWKMLVMGYYMHVAGNPFECLPMRACHHCNLGFHSRKEYLKHIKTYNCRVQYAVTMGRPIPENPLFCKTCNFTATSEKKMQCHKNSYEHTLAVAVKNGDPLPTNEMYCKACEYQFSSVTAFKYHQKTEKHKLKVLEMTFTCEPCLKQFKCKQSLQRHLKTQKHLKTIGEPTKKLQTFCETCDKQLKNRKQFLKHIKTKKHLAKCEAKCVPCPIKKVLTV